MTQRLSNAKEASNKPAALHSHEDLAKKLQVKLCSLPLFAYNAYTSEFGQEYLDLEWIQLFPLK